MTLQKMPSSGIQVATALPVGELRGETKITTGLFNIEILPSSSILVIHKSSYDKILNQPIDKEISIEKHLNNLTKHVGVFIPFIGIPQFIYPNDEKYRSNYNDRINYIIRTEDRLKWISNASIGIYLSI